MTFLRQLPRGSKTATMDKTSNGDDVESSNDTDAVVTHDAHDVQQADNAGETRSKGAEKKRKRQGRTDVASRLRACRHLQDRKSKKAIARKFENQSKRVGVSLAQENDLKTQVMVGKSKAWCLSCVGSKRKHPEWEKKVLIQ